jgi:hypothetical protein
VEDSPPEHRVGEEPHAVELDEQRGVSDIDDLRGRRQLGLLSNDRGRPRVSLRPC